MLFCDSRWQCFAWLVNLTAVGLYSFLPYFWCSSVDSIQFHVACCTAVSSRCRNITDISLLQLLMWSGPKCLPADTCRICVLWRGVCCSCNIYRTLGIVCLWVPYFWNMMECIIMCFSILAPIISTFVQILIMSNTSLILLRWIIIMFPYQNTLTQPQTVHAEGNQYTCDVCNKSFFLCTTFSSHWQTHKQQSQYSCDVCDKSFWDKSNLKRHQSLHTGERLFSCCLCNKSYSDQSCLKQHLKRLHRFESPYSCDVWKRHLLLRWFEAPPS